MISGLNDFISQNSGKPLILNSGESFFPEDPNAICNFNGYLVDEDYFEAPQAYVSDALQSTDEMFAAMQEQINALDSLTTLFEYKFELMNRPLQESLDLGVPLEDLYAVGYNKNDFIGLTYQGGLIFYVDESGLHGLIAAHEDLGPFQYGCYQIEIPGANQSNIGWGLQNSNDIVSNDCNSSDGSITAAQAALNYQYEDFQDWYLPSSVSSTNKT